jgi:sulfate transport system ATP-binding protein
MAIAITGLTRRFGQTPVLNGIDLALPDGELVALLGPSGSGKTTLLRILAGLDHPDAGTLTVNGGDWLALPAQRRGAGLVFQHYALFPHMRVRDNIAFGLTVRPRATRPARAAIEKRVADLLGFLQIEALADRFPAQLSGGQRQRVALARAIATDPAVLLLDEPFGALDAAIRRDLRRWLRGVHEALGITTLFVTHDQEEAFELADRVVVMHAGRIEQTGTPEAIHDRPATPFVARFLGATNELAGRIHAGRIRLDGLDTSPLGLMVLGEGPVTVFARPGDIALSPDPAAPNRVIEAVAGGSTARLRVEAAALGATLDVDLPRRDAHGLAPGTGVRVQLLAARAFPSGNPAAAPVAPLSFDSMAVAAR